MRVFFALFLSILSFACRTTKKEDQRYFAEGKSSKDQVVGVKGGTLPPGPSTSPPPDPFPPPKPIEDGAFYRVCSARDQLPAPQALTVRALLAAVHQRECADGEIWLRNTQNKILFIDSEELVELQTLALLQNYTHIVDVSIKTAKGIEKNCPLRKDQNCHWIKADFE